MKRIALILVLFSSVYSCALFKPRVIHEVYTNVVYKDSIAWRDSLIKVPIPLEKNQVIVTLGDTSHLETSLALSDAFIGGDGFLHHSLENRKGMFDVQVKIPSRMILTNVMSNKTDTITKIEYREKLLSKWRKFQIGAFWWLLGGIVAALLYEFRKPLLKLLKIWVTTSSQMPAQH